MKIIYSQLKNFLPGLDIPAEKLRDDLTLIGHFTNFYEKIGNDIVFDLDIKVNRADCLGYYGLARDLSVFYNLPLKSTLYNLQPTTYPLPITVTSADVVRIQAVKISGLDNSQPSPAWLLNFLKLHLINPINLLVDLTNYIMFLYGLPCHAFDTAKSGDDLVWENNNHKYQDFITLDGTKLLLEKPTLMVNNPHSALSLSFLGGQTCAISANTTETIVEMAVYNRSRVRSDSRQLKTITEAGIRLDKDLDSESIPLAFNHLVQLILELEGGQISSALFEYYPQKPTLPKINFDPAKPGLYAGINIPRDFALDVLKRLGCQTDSQLIIPPSIRQDLKLEEDLIEEVIRFYGYNKIPINEPVSSQHLPDITPKILHLIESLKDQLIALGYDEIRSLPLVRHCEEPCDEAIPTQNIINTDYPVLRQSIIQSLRLQLDEYQRYKLPQSRFFEIGKIFFKKNNKFIEKYVLGIYNPDPVKLSRDARSCVSTNNLKITDCFAEIILDDLPCPESYDPSLQKNQAYELTSQIITLDANVDLEVSQDPTSLITKYTALISPQILWSIELIDVFQNRCTLRVSYYNCDDKTAKKVHLSTFNLTDQTYTYVDPKTETNLLYYSDMYSTQATASIIDIKKIGQQSYAILDQTVFFPEGGGQPSDIGTLSNKNSTIEVSHVKSINNQVLHQAVNNQFSIGDKVTCKIDWNHRYKYMKIHSAGHLLHEILVSLFPILKPIKGFHGDKAYLVYSGSIDPTQKDNIEKLVNQKIKTDLPIICQYVTYDQMLTECGYVPTNLPKDKKLRLLKIGSYSAMPDGGIQVKSTIEIGCIKITSVENNQNQAKIFYQVI